MRLPGRQFLRFCVSGFAGFLCDAALLEAFVALGFTPILARVFSIAGAMQFTYLLHSRFTFRAQQGHSFKRWLSFITANLGAALVNYFTFISVLTLLADLLPQVARFIALLAGTALALVVNYTVLRRYVFRKDAA